MKVIEEAAIAIERDQDGVYELQIIDLKTHQEIFVQLTGLQVGLILELLQKCMASDPPPVMPN